MSDPSTVRAYPVPTAPPPYEGAREDLFDWARAGRYVLFSLGSVRRRPGLFLVVAAGTVLLASAALAVLPKTYEVESRLLAQRSPVLSVRADVGQSDPTRAAAELIVGTDNLHAIIVQTNLLEEWRRRRLPILRLKDWLMQHIAGPPRRDDLLDSLTGLLQKNLVVWTTPDGTVAIRLRWPDGLMAYRLVDAAEQSFLEKRHVLEVSTIAEQISILEAHAARLKEQVEKEVADLQRLRDASTPERLRQAPRPAPLRLIDPEVMNLRVLLDAKRRAISDLEELQRRHLLELQTRLAEQRTAYSESHPSVVGLQQSIESLQTESPQLTALRQEEAELRRKLAKYPDGPSGAVTGMPNVPAELFRADIGGDEDSSVEYARAQLRFAVGQHAAIRERITAARIDLDTAQAAFKYRYSVVIPPEIPRGPIRPRAARVMLAAVVAGLLLALFATTVADLRAGVVLEQWQVEDLIGSSKAIVKLRFPWPPGQLPPDSR